MGNVDASVWVANISTAITTLGLIIVLAKKYLINPFQKWVSILIESSLADLKTTLADHAKALEELQRANGGFKK